MINSIELLRTSWDTSVFLCTSVSAPVSTAELPSFDNVNSVTGEMFRSSVMARSGVVDSLPTLMYVPTKLDVSSFRVCLKSLLSFSLVAAGEMASLFFGNGGGDGRTSSLRLVTGSIPDLVSCILSPLIASPF